MPLSDIFGWELIKVDLEGKTRDEVFEELIEVIAGQYRECLRRLSFGKTG
ncbi:MAG: hypothetical protein LBB98_15060 [Treponema sp.]|jgi:hypothetical protein|nr:hypothetical protein [Treponema sp.]